MSTLPVIPTVGNGPRVQFRTSYTRGCIIFHKTRTEVTLKLDTIFIVLTVERHWTRFRMENESADDNSFGKKKNDHPISRERNHPNE